MKIILFLIALLSCAASAMDIREDWNNDTASTASEKPLQPLQILDSTSLLNDLLSQALQKKNVQAQYELFRTFKNGLHGREKDPKRAIQFGIMARNRPDPHPCVIEELPRYLWNLYKENLVSNPPLAESYLMQGANLRPFDGLCITEDIFAYTGYRTEKDAKNFKPTGYVSKNEEVITANGSDIITDYTCISDFCSEYKNPLNEYANKLLATIDLMYSPTTPDRARINSLHRIKLAINQVVNNKNVHYLWYRKILEMCQSHKIASDYCDQLKNEGFVKISNLGKTLGIETANWPQAYTSNNKKTLIENMKVIQKQILLLIEQNYYLPGFIDIADAYIEDEKYEQALKVYCQLLKHFPDTLDAHVGIDNLLRKMRNLKLTIPEAPFTDLKVSLKHIILKKAVRLLPSAIL